MIRDLASASDEALARAWNDVNPPSRTLSSGLVRSHIFDCSLFLPEGSGVLDNGSWIALKRSASPELYAGYEPNLYHISAFVFRDHASGMTLLKHTIDQVEKRSGRELRFGQDNLHLLPGVPEDDPNTRYLLSSLGFQTKGTVEDFERIIDEWDDSESKQSAARAFVPDDLASLQKFFEREFPNRWRFDVLSVLEREQRPELVSVLEFEGEIEGFALIQSAPMKVPIGGAVFISAQETPWGALGPIGVSRHLQGRGFGDHLLRRSVKLMQNRGVKRVLIDWTHLRTFYGKYGFVPCQAYAPMFLPW